MTRLVLIEDRPGFVQEFHAEGLALVPAHEDRVGMAFVRVARSGVLTVDLALPGHAGYRCITALGGGIPDVPVLAIIGRDDAVRQSALSARLRAFVRRDRALHLAHVAGWPSTLGLPSRDFDRLMAVVRRCGRIVTQPERQYVLTVRAMGFLMAARETGSDQGSYADAWHAMEFAIARDATLERRAIA